MTSSSSTDGTPQKSGIVSTTVSVASSDTSVATPVSVMLHLPAKTLFKIFAAFAIFTLVADAATKLGPMILQLMVAAFVAIAADTVVRRLQGRGIGRSRAVGIVMLGLVVAFGLILAVFVPPIVEQGNNLIDNSPEYVHDLRNSSLYEQVDNRFHIADSATSHLSSTIQALPSKLGRFTGAVVSGVFGVVTFLFMVTFLLLGGGDLLHGTIRLFPRLAERKWWEVLRGAYRNIGSYVVGALSIALIAGVSMTIVLLAVGTKYALPLGLWMLLLDLVPLVGASIGAVPAVAVTFLTSGTIEGIIVLAFVVVYQQVENVIIQPRIQGKASSLPALVIFVSVLAGSTLLGVVGALFAVPIASIVAIVLRQYIQLSGNAEMDIPVFFNEVEEAEEPA